MIPLISNADEVINGIIIDTSASNTSNKTSLDGYRFTSSQGQNIPLVPVTHTPVPPPSSGNDDSSSNDTYYIYFDGKPIIPITTEEFESGRFFNVPPIEEPSPTHINFIEEIQQPQSPRPSHSSAQFSQFETDTRSFHRRVDQSARAWSNHLLLGELTPPAAWLQQQKELGFSDVVLLGQLEYWQLSHYRGMLEKMPAFPVLIAQLADEIRRNPDFMKNSVPGLRYESHYKKYWQDTLGDGVWGTMLGSIASLKSHPDDHSKFQRMVLDYDEKFTAQNAAYNKTLQQNKEAALRAQEPQVDPNDPYDSEGCYTPFPTDVVLPEFDDPFALTNLADQYMGLSGVIPHTPGLIPYRNFVLERAAALKAAAASSYVTQDHRVAIDHTILQQHPELGYVANFSGNQAQLRLHKELAAQINEAGTFARTNSDNILAAKNAPLVYALSNAAAVQDNPTTAFHLSDACFNLNRLTTMLDAVLPPEAKIIGKALATLDVPETAKILGSGVAQGLIATGEHVRQLITHPINTTINDIVQTGQLVSNSLSAAYALTLGSHEEAAAVWNKLEQTGQHLYNHPEQAVALITQMLLPVPGVMALTNAKRLNMLDKISDVVRKELAVSRVVAAAGAQGEMMSFALQPVMQSVKTIQKAAAQVKQGGGKAQKNIPVFRDSAIPVKAEVVVQAHGKRMPGIHWKHVYDTQVKVPNITNGKKTNPRLTGGHSEAKKNFPQAGNVYKDHNALGCPQAPGYYNKDILDKKLVKNSTFFPQDFSKEKIRATIREAYRDAIRSPQKQDNPYGLIGHTNNGVPIRFWFHQQDITKTINSKTTTQTVYYIHSVYPEMR